MHFLENNMDKNIQLIKRRRALWKSRKTFRKLVKFSARIKLSTPLEIFKNVCLSYCGSLEINLLEMRRKNSVNAGNRSSVLSV